MLIQRSQIACEIESPEGSKATLEGADVFLAFNPTFDPTIEAHERDPVRSVLSPHGSVFGKRSASLKFDVELAGTATAGLTSPYADALKACGVAENLTPGTSSVYKPASDAVPSATLGWYLDGKAYKMWGARGTFVLNLEAAKPGILSMDFLGADWEEVDEALLTSGVVYSAIKPPTFQSAALTIDSYAAVVSRLSLDQGNALALRLDANAISGHKSCVITNRKPTLSFDPEDVLVATEAFMANWLAGLEMAFTTTIGSATGNTIAITAPKVQYQTIGQGERDGVSVKEAVGLCCINAGDDEWQISIT